MVQNKGKLLHLLRSIPVLMGWGALGLSIFFPPGLVKALAGFASAPQGEIRQIGLLLLEALGFLVALLLTVRWFDAASARTNITSSWERYGASIHRGGVNPYFLALLLVLGFIFLQAGISGQVENRLDQLFYDLAQPILIWLGSICLFYALDLLLTKDRSRLGKSGIWVGAGIIFICLFSIGTALQLGGFGITATNRVNGNFDLTGYPLLGYQVLFSLVLSTLASVLLAKLSRADLLKGKNKSVLMDLALGCALFLAAILVWKSVPFQEHMFWDTPRPPNYEYYPNSDANLYDRTALNLLTAGRFQTYTYRFDEFIGRRPLLTTFIAGLHLAAGGDYPQISSLQVILFAVLPVLMYLLAKSLFSRSAGLLAGLLIIIREWNGLQLSDVVTGVHPQLLMSEIPTMMSLILFLIILIRALRPGKLRYVWLLVAGGVLGAAMLIRQEVGILLPFISIPILWEHKEKLRSGFIKILVISAGIVLVIAPWMIRNWEASGQIYLDLPGTRFERLLESVGIEKKAESMPEEDQSALAAIANAPRESTSASWIGASHRTGAEAAAALKTASPLPDPGSPQPTNLELITNHFANQLVQSAAYLPSYSIYTDLDFISKLLIGKVDRYYGGIFYSPEAYVKALPYWWNDWKGQIPAKSLLPVLLTVGMISLGLSAARKKERSTALLPLFSYLGYIVIYSLARVSGGRYLQEIDWVSLLYYSIGWVAVVNGLFFTGAETGEQQVRGAELQSAAQGKTWFSLGLAAVVLVGIGASPVVIEGLIPTQYPESSCEEEIQKTLSGPSGLLSAPEQDELRVFLESGGSAVLGKAYYPRYFEVGENLGDIRPEVLGLYPERYSIDRMEFYLIGTDTTWVILPGEEIPDRFPHGSEVLTIGCQNTGVIDALAVLTLDDQGRVQSVLWRGDRSAAASGCPLGGPGE